MLRWRPREQNAAADALTKLYYREFNSFPHTCAFEFSRFVGRKALICNLDVSFSPDSNRGSFWYVVSWLGKEMKCQPSRLMESAGVLCVVDAYQAETAALMYLNSFIIIVLFNSFLCRKRCLARLRLRLI